MYSELVDPYVATIAFFLFLGIALALAGAILLIMAVLYTFILTTIPPWLDGAVICFMVGASLTLLGHLVTKREVEG